MSTTKLFRLIDAAEKIGFSRWTLYRHLADGSIGYVRVGRGKRAGLIAISEDEINRFIRERSVPARSR